MVVGAGDAREPAPHPGQPEVATDEGDVGVPLVDVPDAGAGQLDAVGNVSGGTAGRPAGTWRRRRLKYLCAHARKCIRCGRRHASATFVAVATAQATPWRHGGPCCWPRAEPCAAIERYLDAAGASTLGWYDVLLELDTAPDRRLRMQELGRRAVLSRTGSAASSASWSTPGWSIGTPDPDDGRATLATMTDTGLAAFVAAAPIYLAGIDRHFNRYLSRAQQRYDRRRAATRHRRPRRRHRPPPLSPRRTTECGTVHGGATFPNSCPSWRFGRNRDALLPTLVAPPGRPRRVGAPWKC